MRNYLVLDIETQNLVADWGKPHEAGLAVCCVWTSWDERFHLFGPQDVERLDSALRAWFNDKDPLIVTYNGSAFDLRVLDGLGIKIVTDYHCDLAIEIQKGAGRRHKLEEVARATLGRGKSGHGHQAPALYQAGLLAQLHSYCMDDVALTRDLFLFARRHGYLVVGNKAIPVSVPGGVAGPREVCEPPSKEPATEKQIAYIQQLQGYAWQPTPGLTKSQASEMIEALKARVNP